MRPERLEGEQLCGELHAGGQARVSEISSAQLAVHNGPQSLLHLVYPLVHRGQWGVGVGNEMDGLAGVQEQRTEEAACLQFQGPGATLL